MRKSGRKKTLSRKELENRATEREIARSRKGREQDREGREQDREGRDQSGREQDREGRDQSGREQDREGRKQIRKPKKSLILPLKAQLILLSFF